MSGRSWRWFSSVTQEPGSEKATCACYSIPSLIVIESLLFTFLWRTSFPCHYMFWQQIPLAHLLYMPVHHGHDKRQPVMGLETASRGSGRGPASSPEGDVELSCMSRRHFPVTRFLNHERGSAYELPVQVGGLTPRLSLLNYYCFCSGGRQSFYSPRKPQELTEKQKNRCLSVAVNS